MNRVVSLLLILLAAVGLLAANRYVLNDLLDIGESFPLPAGLSVTAEDVSGTADDDPVRIGVVSRFAPNIIYSGYQPIMDYLNRRGSRQYELRLSTGYQDAVDRLLQGEVTASFLGAWITSRLDPESQLVPLVAPLNRRGKSEFRAVLVTGPGSDLRSLADLARRKVALPSKQAWSGNWLQTTGLPGVGLSTADLDSIQHFDYHETVVWQVLGGNFDAGVVKESVARNYAKEGLRTVTMSPPIPGPPLVGNPQANGAAIAEITSLLLALDPDEAPDREILDSWTEEFSFGFCPVSRDNYSHVFRDQRPDGKGD